VIPKVIPPAAPRRAVRSESSPHNGPPSSYESDDAPATPSTDDVGAVPQDNPISTCHQTFTGQEARAHLLCKRLEDLVGRALWTRRKVAREEDVVAGAVAQLLFGERRGWLARIVRLELVLVAAPVLHP
jgi:hypothetical protein